MESVVKPYARQYTYPFLRDPGTAWNLYKMNSYIPLNYVIDTAGVVVGSMEGFNEATIRSWIEPYLTGVVEERGVRLELAGATPSPATGRQTVKFNLPMAGNATLRVYSSAGQLVRTLVAGSREAGSNVVTWDLRDDGGRLVGNGTYVYQLTAAGRSARMKTSVLR